MSDTDAVLFANSAFYAAFAGRDFAAMQRLWADGDISCIHPGWPPLLGHDAVMTSWRNILGNEGSPRVVVRNAGARIHGPVAIVTCIEVISDPGTRAQALSATNVFVKGKGPAEWRIIHHQGGLANIDPRTITEDAREPVN